MQNLTLNYYVCNCNDYTLHFTVYTYLWLTRTQHYRLQDERLEVLQSMLKQREVDHQALNDKRLEHLW